MRTTQAFRELKKISESYNKWFKVNLYEQVKDEIRQTGVTLEDILNVWINQVLPIGIEENKDDTILILYFEKNCKNWQR